MPVWFGLLSRSDAADAFLFSAASASLFFGLAGLVCGELLISPESAIRHTHAGVEAIYDLLTAEPRRSRAPPAPPVGGSPVRFHLAKSRNCGLLPISPKRTEGLCLLAGCRSLTRTTLQRNWRISNSVSYTTRAVPSIWSFRWQISEKLISAPKFG